MDNLDADAPVIATAMDSVSLAAFAAGERLATRNRGAWTPAQCAAATAARSALYAAFDALNAYAAACAIPLPRRNDDNDDDDAPPER